MKLQFFHIHDLCRFIDILLKEKQECLFTKKITIFAKIRLIMKNNLLVYILLCLLNLSWANARNKQQEAEALIKKSVDAIYNNPKQASYYAAKVIELFPEERQNDQKAEAMFYYSQAEKLLGNFDVSIKNLYDALEYATPTNKELNGQIYALIGALYSKLTDYN